MRSALEPGSSVHNSAHAGDYPPAKLLPAKLTPSPRPPDGNLDFLCNFLGDCPPRVQPGGPDRDARPFDGQPRPPLRVARPSDPGGSAAGAGMLVALPRGACAAALAVLGPVGAGPIAEETCPALFADGRAPVLTNPKLAARTVPLCFEAFAVLHSGVTRTPLYSAEHLTRASVADARTVAPRRRVPRGGAAAG